MTDLVSRLLEAIDQRAAKATAALDMAVVLNWPRLNGKATMRAYLHEVSPSSTLRRCAADRRTVEEWLKQVENPFNGLSDVPPYFIVNLFEAYGLEVTE